MDTTDLYNLIANLADLTKQGMEALDKQMDLMKIRMDVLEARIERTNDRIDKALTDIEQNYKKVGPWGL